MTTINVTTFLTALLMTTTAWNRNHQRRNGGTRQVSNHLQDINRLLVISRLPVFSHLPVVNQLQAETTTSLMQSTVRIDSREANPAPSRARTVTTTRASTLGQPARVETELASMNTAKLTTRLQLMEDQQSLASRKLGLTVEMATLSLKPALIT